MYKKHKKSIKVIPKVTPGFGYWGGFGVTDIGISYGDIKKGEDPDDPRHFRKKGTMFFIVMTGTLLLEIDGEEHKVDNENVYELSPGTVYRVVGSHEGDCKWIAIGTVNTVDDKIVVGNEE